MRLPDNAQLIGFPRGLITQWQARSLSVRGFRDKNCPSPQFVHAAARVMCALHMHGVVLHSGLFSRPPAGRSQTRTFSAPHVRSALSTSLRTVSQREPGERGKNGIVFPSVGCSDRIVTSESHPSSLETVGVSVVVTSASNHAFRLMRPGCAIKLQHPVCGDGASRTLSGDLQPLANCLQCRCRFRTRKRQ